MSHETYNRKWQSSMQELAEQVQVERMPELYKSQGYSLETGFSFFAGLYVKYIKVFNKLEDCYDQIVHPQKREAIKPVLENVAVRMLELRNLLKALNPRPGNSYLALDDILAELKTNPDETITRVPRYFRNDAENADSYDVKIRRLDTWLEAFHGAVLEEQLDPPKWTPPQAELSVEQVIELIQRNERGRMGIVHAKKMIAYRKAALQKEAKAKAGDDDAAERILERETHAASVIISHWKRALIRKRFLKVRTLELEFLDMAVDPSAPFSDQASVNEIARKRRQLSMAAEEEMRAAQVDIKENVKEEMGDDIRRHMLEERRKWILATWKETAAFPNEMAEFYTDETEADDADKDKKDTKGKDKDKKDDKKGKGKGDTAPPPLDLSPTETVETLQGKTEEFTATWEGRIDPPDKPFDETLMREREEPQLEEEVRQAVDGLMAEELEALKNLYVEKGKKKKDKKKKEKKEKKPKKKKCCSGEALIPTNMLDCFAELVKDGILIKKAPAYLQDFVGAFGHLAAKKRVAGEFIPAPGAYMIKRMIVERCIMPLGSAGIRERAPFACRSLLLFGPQGAGKTALAHAIATEVGAMFFDISPRKIAGLYTTPKTGTAELVHKVLVTAQENAPSVIYMDECDQIFKAGKKKKGGGGEEDPSRIKKDLVSHLKKLNPAGETSTSADRVLFVGCTRLPYADHVDTKELLNFFEEKVWVNLPDLGSRMLLYQKFFRDEGVQLSSDFPLTALAQLSEGYPAGSIKEAVKFVLTEHRKTKIKARPLRLDEFVGPLSRAYFSFPEERTAFRDWDHMANGEKERLEKAREAANEAAAAKKK